MIHRINQVLNYRKYMTFIIRKINVINILSFLENIVNYQVI